MGWYSGWSHSKHEKKPGHMDYSLSMATPMGDSLVCKSMLNSCVIQIKDREMLAD